MKPTKRQLDIMTKMYHGWIILVGQSETTGMTYYCISKGFDNDYFKSDVFSRLIQEDIIYQGRDNYYVLTDKAEDYIHDLLNN